MLVNHIYVTVIQQILFLALPSDTLNTCDFQIKEKEDVISQLVSDMQRMKTTLGEVVVGGESGGAILNQNVAAIRLEDDEEYFNSYSHFGIHHEMLAVNSFYNYWVFRVR